MCVCQFFKVRMGVALGSYQQQKLKLHLQLDQLELNTPNGLKAAALANEEGYDKSTTFPSTPKLIAFVYSKGEK